ncbi:MAG: HAD family phosphatase [bacterium]|nr:HAD family phosphatase [bacterium]
MGAIYGIAFDLEGTVVDLERFHMDSFILAAAEFGLAVDFERMKRDIPYLIGGGDQIIADGLSRLSGGRIAAVDLRQTKKQHFERLLHEVRVAQRPGFASVLREVKKLELPIAIASLTDRELAGYIFRKSGVDRLFPKEQILLLEDVRAKKPAPDVYLETARRMGIRPSEQLVFEDSRTGIEAARAAGSAVVAVPVFRTRDVIDQLLDAGASRIFFDWRELNIGALLTNLREES